MLVTIDHETTYTYDEEVAYSIQSLCLTPLSFDGQRVQWWKVKPSAKTDLHPVHDGFGNLMHTLVFDHPHREHTIRVQGVVETFDTKGVVTGVEERFPPYFFLRETPQSKGDRAIQELAENNADQDGSRIATLHNLMNAIRDAIEYRIGETEVGTTASEALAHGYGVCQDHAHVFLAASRYLGIPARYVSGYLVHPEQDGSGEASHAWAEAYVDDLGWVGFDVANRICPTDHYVRVAYGLDYQSVAPVKGIRRGGGTENIAVAVRTSGQMEQASQQ